jgi:flagellar basal-body rod protein FlgC
MLAAIATAVSGMFAATRRLEASTNNIANMSSRGALASRGMGPAAYQPVGVEQTAITGGGTLATVRIVSPAWLVAYDPEASFADDDGMIAEPNVDLVGEALEQATAETQFRASAKALQAAQDMVRVLYELD